MEAKFFLKGPKKSNQSSNLTSQRMVTESRFMTQLIIQLPVRRFVMEMPSRFNLKLLKHKFSFICVFETWTTVSTEQFIEIPGYDCICRSRSLKRGGGLALYVDSDMNVSVKLRSDLDSLDSSVYKSLIVQISQPTISVKDIIIGVIYKPPNTNVENFLSHFIVVLEKLSKENRPSYLLGDYNIDLLKYNHHSESFLNQLLTYGFFFQKLMDRLESRIRVQL